MGAPFEGGLLEQVTWRILVGRKLRWTDDTDMAIGLAQWLVDDAALDPDALAMLWAERADWKRGYGPGALKTLTLIKTGMNWREANVVVFADGSMGNGAAMRAAPLGLAFHDDPERLSVTAALASSITHAHPIGVEGGVLIARATALALDPDLKPDAFLASWRAAASRTRFGRAWHRPDVG